MGSLPTVSALVKLEKLRLIQYRILTKTLTTNIKRHKWDRNVSYMCTFCKKKSETILHILVCYPKVEKLWLNLSKIIAYYYGEAVTFTPELIILNNYKGPCKEQVNSMMIILF